MVTTTWRQKQLEYSWLRSLMNAHADFWQVTREALDFALSAAGNDDPALRDDLLPLYLDNQPIDLIFDINEAATQALDKFEY